MILILWFKIFTYCINCDINPIAQNIYCKVYNINLKDIVLILGFIMLDFIILGLITIDLIFLSMNVHKFIIMYKIY